MASVVGSLRFAKLSWITQEMNQGCLLAMAGHMYTAANGAESIKIGPCNDSVHVAAVNDFNF